MLRGAVFLALVTLGAGCKPAASDGYRSPAHDAPTRTAPSEPIASPDTSQSAWAPNEDGARLLYGDSGAAPFFSLACEEELLVITRHVSADANAKAVLALIGNGHVERVFVDAEQQGERWVWRGRLPANDPRLDVLTGGRRVEATIPGAGSLILNPSSAPAMFIADCASGSAAPSAPEDPA